MNSFFSSEVLLYLIRELGILVYNPSNLDYGRLTDEEIKTAKLIKELGKIQGIRIDVESEELFALVLKQSPEDVKRLLMDYLGLVNWKNTLFERPDIPLEEKYLMTAIHYLTTYGAELFGLDVPTYFPNPPEKMSLDEIVKVIEGKEPINSYKILKVLDYNTARKELVKHLINLKSVPEDKIDEIIEVIIDVLTDDEIRKMKSAVLKGITVIKKFKPVELLKPSELLNAAYYLTYKTVSPTKKLMKNVDEINIDVVKYFESLIEDRKIFEKLYAEPFSGGKKFRIFLNKLIRYNEKFKTIKNYLFRNSEKVACKARKEFRDIIKLLPGHYLQFYKKSDISKLNNKNLLRLYHYLTFAIKTTNSNIVILPNGAKLLKDKYVHNIKNIHEYEKERKNVIEEIKNRLYKYGFFNLKIKPGILDKVDPSFLKRGTVLHIPEDAKQIFMGIYWRQFEKGERVDIDLMAWIDGVPYGWNAEFEGNGVWFSGDMTEAPYPEGASEVYTINNPKEREGVFIYHNYNGEKPETLLFGWGYTTIPFIDEFPSLKEFCETMNLIIPNNSNGEYLAATLHYGNIYIAGDIKLTNYSTTPAGLIKKIPSLPKYLIMKMASYPTFKTLVETYIEDDEGIDLVELTQRLEDFVNL